MHQSLKLSAQFIKCLYCSFWEQLKDVYTQRVLLTHAKLCLHSYQKLQYIFFKYFFYWIFLQIDITHFLKRGDPGIRVHMCSEITGSLQKMVKMVTLIKKNNKIVKP